jgi:hypothetical protein
MRIDLLYHPTAITAREGDDLLQAGRRMAPTSPARSVPEWTTS